MGKRKAGIEQEYIWNVEIDGKIEEIPDSIYKVLQSSMFLDIWREREHVCEVSKDPLIGEPRLYYFHHILEKRNYERYALCRWNIMLLKWEIHDAYERNPILYPPISQRKSELLNMIDGHYSYDNESIWLPGRNHSLISKLFKVSH